MRINCLLLFCFTSFFLISGVLSAQTDDKIYEAVKYMPIFPGCEYGDRSISTRTTCSIKKIEKFLKKNFEYPAAALEEKVEGEVVIGFVVEKDGRITNIEIEKSLCATCDSEMLRLVQLLPDFVPGRQKHKPLRVKTMITIPFESPNTSDPKEVSKGDKSQPNKKELSTNLKRDLARARINRLNKGVLVVKLMEPTQKYKKLKQLVASASSGNKRAAFKQQLDDLKVKTDKENKALMAFFSNKEYYSFSDVVFIFDKDVVNKQLGSSNRFLNAEMQPDPSISIADREYFTTQVGSTPRGEDARTVYKAFVTRAPEGGILSAPFPAYISWINTKQKSGTRFKINGVLNAELEVSDAVKKFNEVMKYFYQKANDWD